MTETIEKVIPPKGTVGAQLKAAREETGRPLADIAQEMHMKVVQLERLENDDYENLPDTVFVLGYIRTFSRLVDVDASPLVKQFPQERPVKEPPPHSASIDEVMDYEPRARTGLLTLLLVVLSALLVAAVVILLRGGNPLNGIMPQNFTPMADEEKAAIIPSDEEILAPASVTQAGGWLTIQSPEPSEGLLTPAVKAPVLTYEGEGLGQVISLPKITGAPQETKSLAPQLPKISLSVKKANQAIEVAPVPKKVSDASLAMKDVAKTPVKKNTSKVSSTAIFINEKKIAGVSMTAKMEFSEDSWVRVNDAYNKSLLSGLQPAGVEKVLEGDGPFNIFLGNGKGVIVSVDGTPYDFSSTIRSNRTARFTLSK